MALQTVNFSSSTNWTVPTKCFIISRLLLVGGGGGGGGGNSTTNGGGGGAGGRVLLTSNINVTPGSSIAVSIGNGGSAGAAGANGGTGGTTSFGAFSVTGGAPGLSNGTGGASSASIFGTVVSTSGGSPSGIGGGGAGAGQSGSSPGTGGRGYLYNGVLWGGGGGGGIATATQGTARPIATYSGGAEGGATGAGEFQDGSAGGNSRGGGGGGGQARTTTTQRGTLANYNNSPASAFLTSGPSAGGTGGTGYAQVQYDEAEAVLRPDGSGVGESGSIIIRLFTKHIPNGVTLPYTISGTGIISNDFSPATLTGNFTVSSTDGGQNGTAQITISIASDSITEGEDLVTVSLNNGLASTYFRIGDLFQTAQIVANDAVGYLVPGQQYTILSAGTTDWTLLGSPNNTVSTTFTATASGAVDAGNFLSGKSYTIINVANFDFTKIGASANTVGTTFTATASGFELASAMVNGRIYTVIELGTTDFTTVGLGWVTAGSFQIGQSYIIKDLGSGTDFTAIGASSNSIGVEFVASGAGTGTGKALPTSFIQAVGQSFSTTGSASGTGRVMPSNTVNPVPAHPILGKAIQGNGVARGIWVSKNIQVADYNNIQAKVASVLGTGSGNSGYAQYVFSSQLSTSSRITINEWNNLKYDIINAHVHQTGSAPSIVTPVANTLVKANVATSPYRQYDALADVIVAQKFNIASSQGFVRTGPFAGSFWYTERAWPGTLGAKWESRIYSIVNVTWASSALARQFFNSGGEIRFASARTGGTDVALATQGAAWQTLLQGSGTQGFGGNKPGQDTGTLNGTNFYRLQNGFNVWYSNTATNPYSTNIYQISARTPGIANNSAGIANSIEFQVEWIDNHPSLGSVPEGVDGTFNLSVTLFEPSGTMQPSGTFSVTVPTIDITVPITT